MAFATYQDLEDRLRVTFTAAEQVQAVALLESATSLIQAAARQVLEQVTGDTVTLDGNGQRILTLPQIPVTAVSSVTVDGETLTFDTHYRWSPNGLLYRTWDGFWGRQFAAWGDLLQSIVVVYSHGYAAIPDDLRTVCVEVAARAWSTPAGAVRSESIGSYSVTYDTNSATTTGVALTDAEKTIVGRYSAAVA